MTGITQNCPCRSGRFYADCCQPFHVGARPAATAQALMRSRYSAYVIGDIEYLVKTTLPARRSNRLREGYEVTHRSISWLGLEILDTWMGAESDKVGKVEFRADYEQNGRRAVHHEVSRFRKVGGKWFYVDGEVEDRPL